MNLWNIYWTFISFVFHYNSIFNPDTTMQHCYKNCLFIVFFFITKNAVNNHQFSEASKWNLSWFVLDTLIINIKFIFIRIIYCRTICYLLINDALSRSLIFFIPLVLLTLRILTFCALWCTHCRSFFAMTYAIMMTSEWFFNYTFRIPTGKFKFLFLLWKLIKIP